MKIMNEVFLSFETRDEYTEAVNIWKSNMLKLVRYIRNNKHQIVIDARRVAKPYEYTQFFQIESLISLAELQRTEISLAKTATQMLKIRAKMKKLAGKQREERLASLPQKELVGV